MCVRKTAQVLVRAGKESRTAEAPTRTMSSAADRLYKEFLLKKLPTIVSRVKAREIVVHLHCLTDHDRENIEAKREVCGNYDSMALLLDCLKRRDNWPEQFIDALEACGHPAIAADVREKYNALRGGGDSSSSSPPANVVRAHVHPAPSAAPLPVPETTPAAAPPAAAPPAAAPPAAAPPAAEASPPEDTPTPPQAAQPAAALVPEVDAAPEAAPEPPLPVQIQAPPAPSTPPPSPETPRLQTPPPPRETAPHQEPVEDTETDSVSVDTSPPSGPVEVSDVDSGPGPDPEVRPESPPPAQIVPEVNSSVHIETPEKPPVQDTSPPAAVPLPDPDPEAAAATTAAAAAVQVVESTPVAMATGGHLLDDGDVCLSKPGELLSVRPEAPGTLPAPGPPAEPYSGDSGRLEMSAAAQTRRTPPPCQENGIAAVNHNEPEENHYESPCPSLDVRENVVQIHQEPSILDMDGQTFTPPLGNGEAAKEVPSAPAVASSDAAGPVSGLDLGPPEPEKPESRSLPPNTKYILTACGVGACAVLLAWRFKH
ncbi:uncharacterized protein V6R79_017492 [Siganus canaliculatus]